MSSCQLSRMRSRCATVPGVRRFARYGANCSGEAQLPGPAIRTRVGDTVRVRLVNPPEAEVSHSIDFHASQVAWNDEMRSIAPGEELIYEFTTDYAGVWMYHCGTAPALHHIGNGMFGAVIIDPPDLPPVDHELLFVQSELYLGPEGQPGDLAKMTALAKDLWQSQCDSVISGTITIFDKPAWAMTLGSRLSILPDPTRFPGTGAQRHGVTIPELQVRWLEWRMLCSEGE